MTSYMNRRDVQEALHVVVGTVWEVSSSKIRYSEADMLRPMMPYYNRLLDDYDMTILVYSGVRMYSPECSGCTIYGMVLSLLRNSLAGSALGWVFSFRQGKKQVWFS